ncbi:uncharacterized protein LOC129581929 [Paramacrobiotus metropolitanus]|uniref:uncharacterized protein LOC129581929 n=1 Tax=Paramacrobiotus metropolitanus TaxID=2943436 RepID=UPI002445A7B6|nr:uncharacterized protein LOC129581929 [Paramacrobiotus metropolitanus]XP_055329210.1 uncharacterized protein LOC129581929 [Paramacrobiotus metropolitanus]XP_055329211.1 uncharacterized protein LOC129581929 [Paramacrobiotus metropolitanus]XP_055329212.1 uncharacterized protein LOC129581929 [Paramacrobiotus metropolitanus]
MAFISVKVSTFRLCHPVVVILAGGAFMSFSIIYYFAPVYLYTEQQSNVVYCEIPCMTSCGQQTNNTSRSSGVTPRFFHITSFDLTCLIVQDDAWNSYVDAFNEKVRRIFLSNSVKQFMTAYTNDCHPNRRLFGGFLGHSPGLGFGSYLSNGLGAYHIAQKTGRRYQLVHHEWPYENLATYFDDFARSTQCPLMADLSDWQAERLLRHGGTYTVTYENNTVTVSKDVDAAPLNSAPEFDQMRYVIRKLYQIDFPGEFRTKSLLAKSLWQLKPEFREFIKVLLSSALSNGFIGVHMRRTDKITSKEMADIPIERFAEEIRKILETEAYARCVVFVMTDDEAAFELLRNLLRKDTCSVHSIVDLSQVHGFNPKQLFVNPLKQVNHHVTRLDRAYWVKHTTQLILEVTILALADDVVCTLSSNLCNVVALLRGSRNGTLHSLDVDWCPSNYTGHHISCVLHAV